MTRRRGRIAGGEGGALDVRPLGGETAARFDIPPSLGEEVPIPPGVPAPVAEGLRSLGVRALWAHQGEALRRVAAGENVVVATPPSSGKSLCALLPLLARLHDEPGARFLLVYPTKALARDQEAALGAMMAACGVGGGVVACDGDTPPALRRAARSGAAVVITNPDMLHASILPRHPSWASFLSSLRLVLVDELHQYRGVFGSHVANVMRRLGRVLAFHGARPSWIALSATIRNPREAAEALTGEPFSLVDRGAAPSPGASLSFVVPAVVDARTGERAGFFALAAGIAAALVRGGLQTIVFANSHRAVELLVRAVRERLRGEPALEGSVKGYRGGYLPRMRRQVERELRSGALRCVVATSALELGIDIGTLDAAVLAGYPGTVAALLQRVGRVGRRHERGVAVLVASGSPLDQFVAGHAAQIVGANPESAHVNPDNLEILLPHVRCAAAELPIGGEERLGGLGAEESREVLRFLCEEGELVEGGGRYFWGGGGQPPARVSLRSAGGERWRLVDEHSGELLEELEHARVMRSLHAEAVYAHAGVQYEVTRIDPGGRSVSVRESREDWYTLPVVEARLSVLATRASKEAGGARVAVGEVAIAQRMTGYKRVRGTTGEVLSLHPLEMPETRDEVAAVWLRAEAREAGALAAMLEGLRGLGHLMCQLGSLRLMCDPKDLGFNASLGIDGQEGDEGGAAGWLFVHEMAPGGVGLARGFFDAFEGIAGDCRQALEACRCAAGCPSCVGPPEGRDDRRKEASLFFLDRILLVR